MHPLTLLDVPKGHVAIHWFGQSSFALKDPSATLILVDPYFPHERPADRLIHATPPLDEASLRPDVVLLTHNHMDHTHPETIKRIEASHKDVQYVGPQESIAALRGIGVDASRCRTVDSGDRCMLQTMTCHVVYAKPPEGVTEDGIDPPDVTHLGFVVDTGTLRVYISGDPINTFANHESLLRPIRQLRPDIGLMTQHPTEGEFPFFEGTVKAAESLKLKSVVPAHYGCFVKRTYNPHEWATMLPEGGPRPLIIGYNQTVLYPMD